MNSESTFAAPIGGCDSAAAKTDIVDSLIPACVEKKDRSSARPVRALQVLGSLNLGGIEGWLMEVVRHTSRDDLAIDVCTTSSADGVYDEEFISLGGVIHRCPLHRNPWAFGERLEQLLRTHRYDVVHSHLFYFSGFVLRSAARADVPIRVAHIHTMANLLSAPGALRLLYRRWMRRWIDKYGTNFVAASKAGLESIWGPNWHVDPRKQVLYCGISLERFRRSGDRAAVRAELGLPADATLLLNVGRFIPTKRQALLVDIAGHVAARRRGVYFVLIGAGPLQAEVERKAHTSGLSDIVRFVPAQPGIERFWLAADAFVFPSVREGLPIVIIEAVAAGLPIVACDIPGVREAASASFSATLLPLDGTIADWSREILDALARPSLSDADRHALFDRFPFSIEASIQSLQGIYRRSSSQSMECRS
ncbi:MAG: glycosyltransferase [Planctomycetes bacterium]|nr:glycosyltransferase [Planctomycetota bacterium]MBI3834810.1 glycosyltransferase [Planctomycetota bacterium]